MTYAEALEHLYALAPELAPTPTASPAERHKFDLAHMRRLMKALGDPQNKVPSVLIAGTNGKGSTSATLASILTAAGYRAGLYTSPHLVRVTERIQLAHPILPSEYGTSVAGGAAPGADGKLSLSPIAEDIFGELYEQVDEAAKALVESGELPFAPSFFERLTAIAFLFFAQQQAEIMILEVGLGGRLDATNVVDPMLSVITDIALDHQDYLGDTIAEITAEKCGILREAGTMITLPQLPEANQAIGVAATDLQVHAINAARYIPSPERAASAPMRRLDRVRDAALTDFGPHYHPRQGQPSPGTPAILLERAPATPLQHVTRNVYSVSMDATAGEEAYELQVDSPLAGQHQQRNIALAIAAAVELRSQTRHNPVSISNGNRYRISNRAIEEGIRETSWPGRLEFLPPNLLLDVAHNPAGAWTLRSALAALPEEQPRTLIFSCLKDKSLTDMSRILFPLFDSSADGDPLRRQDHIILAPISNARASAVEDLLAAARQLGIPAHAAPHLAGALAQARQITAAGGVIVATGSVYLVGEIRQLAMESELVAG